MMRRRPRSTLFPTRRSSDLVGEIDRHLANNRAGEILRDGVSVAILGPPNVGKSSLINMIAQRDVAITSAVAGTTRDVIEVRLDLAGYPVILADTAGLREARDAIEAEGIKRARARAAAADLTIVVLDIARPDAAAAMTAELATAAIVVANKLDLLEIADRDAALARLPTSVVALPTVTGEGLPLLLDRLGETVKERYAATTGPVLTRSRHRAARAAASPVAPMSRIFSTSFFAISASANEALFHVKHQIRRLVPGDEAALD